MDTKLKDEIIEILREYMALLHYNNRKNNYANHIEEYKIDKIENVLHKMCQHEWVKDSVDDCFGYSRNIEYCSKCEITKK